MPSPQDEELVRAERQQKVVEVLPKISDETDRSIKDSYAIDKSAGRTTIGARFWLATTM